MAEFLKCDRPGCDHVEKVGRITADMVGLPCPKCGDNLLNQEDWENWQTFSALFGILSEAVDGVSDGPHSALSIKVGLHGKKSSVEFERIESKEGREDG